MPSRYFTRYRCLMCKADDVELDDAMTPTDRATCVCVACYRRTIGQTPRVPDALRAAVNREEGDLLLRGLGPDERMATRDAEDAAGGIGTP